VAESRSGVFSADIDGNLLNFNRQATDLVNEDWETGQKKQGKEVG